MKRNKVKKVERIKLIKTFLELVLCIAESSAMHVEKSLFGLNFSCV